MADRKPTDLAARIARLRQQTKHELASVYHHVEEEDADILAVCEAAEKAQAELKRIKSENSVTWHEAAILAAQNRDAKLKERDQLRDELTAAKAGIKSFKEAEGTSCDFQDIPEEGMK